MNAPRPSYRAGFSGPERGPNGQRMRPFLIALPAIALAAIGIHSFAHAQAIASHDTSAPVEFGADQIELQDKANRVVLSGDVVITQGDLTVRAARATVAYTDAGELEIQRLDAVGGVTVARGRESASGAVAVYDFSKRLITMSGGVTLRRGNDMLQGGRLVINLRSGLSSVDGRASGQTTSRVSGTFTVPK